MQRVVDVIRKGCSMDTQGGRVQTRHDCCVVLDVHTFPDELVTQLKQMNAEIRFQSDSSSLSGFRVEVSIQSSFTELLLTGTIIACMGAVIAHCLHNNIYM